MNELDSKAPTAEKAQHDPHYPWFFTFWTAPFVLQSKLSFDKVKSSTACELSLFFGKIKVKYIDFHSSLVISMNEFGPNV